MKTGQTQRRTLFFPLLSPTTFINPAEKLMSNAWHCLSFLLTSSSDFLEDSLYSDIFHYESASLRVFWIILNCLLHIKQHLILLMIPENLRNLLVKNTFPLNNVIGGQIRNAVSYFFWILTNKSFNTKALPYKCNIIARCIVLLSTNKMENALEKLIIEQNCPNFSKSITEKFCFKLLWE